MDKGEVVDTSRADLNAAKQTYRYWLVLGATVFILTLFVSVTDHHHSDDDAWYLQVLNRVVNGEVLYRDMFFGATPLAVYVALPFVKIFGVEFLVLKVLGAVVFTLTVLLCCRIARQLGSSRNGELIIVTMLLVYLLSVTKASHTYQPLATLFFLGCFSAVLAWREKRSGANSSRPSSGDDWLVLAAVSAAFCFTAKQNIGLLVLGALLASVVAISICAGANKRELARALVVLSFVFIVVNSLVLLPVWLSGGWGKFWDFGFIGKGNYIRFGTISYWEGIRQILPKPNRTFNLDLFLLYLGTSFLLPAVTYPLTLLTWRRVNHQERSRLLTILFFLTASLAGGWPRVDLIHMIFCLPLFILGLVYIRSNLGLNFGRRLGKLMLGSLLLWLGFGLLVTFLGPARRMITRDYTVSKLPHFRGLVVLSWQENEFRTSADALMRAAKDEREVFIMSPKAGFYYLLTGLRNPTPFDYPYVTTFGLRGEAEIMEAISQRRIGAVCIDHLDTSGLRPLRLEQHVREQMKRQSEAGFCTLYR